MKKKNNLNNATSSESDGSPRNLLNEDMEEIFISRFLNNISLSEKEKNFILNNTFAEVQVVDPVRGNDIVCSGKIAEDLK